MYLQNLLIWFTAIFSQWALDHFGEWMKNNYLCVVNLKSSKMDIMKLLHLCKYQRHSYEQFYSASTRENDSSFSLGIDYCLEKRNFREGIDSVTSASSLIIIIMSCLTHIFLIPPCIFRWVCTSGLAADLATTDEIARKVLEQIMAEGCEFQAI